MKTTIKTLSYFIALLVLFIWTGCGEKDCSKCSNHNTAQCESLKGRLDSCLSATCDVESTNKANKQCAWGKEFSVTDYRFDIDWANKRIRIADRSSLIFECEYPITSGTTIKLEIKPKGADKVFVASNNVFSPAPGAGIGLKELKHVANPIYADIVLNNCSLTNVTGTVYKIIGTDDDRNGATPKYTVANLENNPVFIKYTAAGGGQPEKFSITSANTKIDVDFAVSKASIQADLQ